MDNNLNKKILSFTVFLGGANFICSMFYDKASISPENYPGYFASCLVGVIIAVTLFMLNTTRGFNRKYLDASFITIMSWGVYAQFLIPAGYLSTVIGLFIYSLFSGTSLKKFFCFTSFFSLLITLAIWFSKSIEMQTAELASKAKTDLIYTTIMMTLFVNITYFFKARTQEAIQRLESKWIDLGSQSSIFIHDLKNMVFPLTNHSNFLLKKQDQLPEFAQNINKEMNESVKVMSEYIQEFNQSFSFKHEKTNISLSEIVETAKKIYKNKIGNVEISVSQSGEWVEDNHMIKSIINNLMINSGDAFSEKKVPNPKISLSFSKNQLVYSDNAGGLPAQKLKDIKDDVYFSTKKAGSGIGIFTIKKYVSLLKGKVSFDNKNNGIYVVIDLNR